MSGHTKWAEIKARRGVAAATLPPEEGRGEGFGLGEIRAAVGMTQAQVAERMGVDQPRVSRFERQDDLYLSTLRDYIRGLGGELEMLVRLPDDKVYWFDPPEVERMNPDGAPTTLAELAEDVEARRRR